ncbi:MAG: septal ring lytic transglycosylase RlpA family protein [Hyphomicrobiaceae bacterium]
MKKRIISAAVIAAGLLASAPARADGWADAFSSSHSYSRLEKAGGSEGRSRFSGRSNLGAMTSDDDVRPTARSRRASRAAAAAEAREERRSRSGRVTTTSFSGGGGSGIASYYWQPQRVASGGMFNPNAMTAAHKTLPFGTRVRVTNHHNGRSAVVTINDRGPFVRGRVIDLSRAAASSVGMIGSGLARVTLEVLGR